MKLNADSLLVAPGRNQILIARKSQFTTLLVQSVHQRIDFTGHLIVNIGSKTKECYVCLFTCSTTRNVNLEIVNDLSTNQFLLAFRHHCSIYGTPSLIVCDNSKTFHKGDEKIKKLFQVKEINSCPVTALGRHVRVDDQCSKIVNQESSSLCSNQSARDANTH